MIPQNNPLANYSAHRAEIDKAVNRVLEGGRYILSDETARFEKDFSFFIGTNYAVGTGNGTEALLLALCALGVGQGDEVITVSHTAVATVAAIEMSGARPVLIDVDSSSYTMNPELLEKVRTERTKAIVPVHLYGQPCDLEPTLDFARSYGIRVIEDCAQSHGAQYQGRRVGSWGDAGAFSFYPTKNLGCLGDGGAVTTNDEGLYTRLLSLRQYGWDRSRVSQISGFNSRLDELQAAILRVKLAHLEQNNQKRKTIARYYDEALAGKDLVLPTSAPVKTHVYHQYVVRCPEASYRNALAGFLVRKGIQTAVHYPTPVHLQPAYLKLLRAPNSLPVTEEICQTILSLPMFPELKEDELAAVSQGISEFIRGKR
jgi:dTDP-4-amino-4,6-dideoxygalactose transaminase